MGRGFLSGVIWGLLVTGAGGVTLSVLDRQASMTPPTADATALNDATMPVLDGVGDEDVPVVVDISTPDVSGFSAIDGNSQNAPEIQQNDAPELPKPQAMQPAPPQPEQVPTDDTQSSIAPAPEVEAETMDVAVVEPSEVAPKTDGAAMPEVADAQIAELPDSPEPQSPIAPEAQEEILEDTTPELVVVAEPEDSEQPTTIKINRLPAVGDEPEAAAKDDPQTTPQDEVDSIEASIVTLGLKANAMAFDNPDAKPVLSVILIDSPDRPISDAALENLLFPLSFAIDATRDDAADVAARYYNAGFEVLMLTNLPAGAKASDIEVSFEAYSHALPRAVAMLDQGGKGFLRGSTASQIAGILSDRGLGLVTPSKGLNSAQRAAEREGVASALIYRELDGDGADADKIGRNLDNAAFRAGQEGDVLMLGHTHPETIRAMMQWALEGRASNLAIGPVSAILMGK